MEENHIFDGFQVAADWEFPLTTRDLQDEIHSDLEKLESPQLRFNENYPGEDRIAYFREKHPQLTNCLVENIKRNRAEIFH